MARFGDILRGFASVLNPQVAAQVAEEDKQERAARQQLGVLAFQNAVADKRFQEEMAFKKTEAEEARRFREAEAAKARAAQLSQFEQGLDLRRDTLNFQRSQAIAAAKTAEERAAVDKMYKEGMLKLHEQGLELKKSLGGATQQQIVGNEAKLRDDFNKLSGSFIKVRDAHQRVIASANDPSAAGDLALIFNYMKVLDPESVVRESEFAQAAATGAFGERIKSAVNRVVKGERLSDAIRKDFLDRSERLYNAAEKNQSDLETRFKDISGRSGVNHENVVIPYRTSKPKSGSDKVVDFSDLK